MFETNDLSESQLPIHLKQDGVRDWQYCQINGFEPWYLIEYEHSQFGNESRFLVLIYKNEHLFNLQQNKEIKITQAHIVTPNKVNQSVSWQVSMLRKVIQTDNKNFPSAKQVTFYELTDGRKLSFPIRVKKEISHSEYITIFTAHR